MDGQVNERLFFVLYSNREGWRLFGAGSLRLLINFSYTAHSAPAIATRSTVMSSTATQSNMAPAIRPGGRLPFEHDQVWRFLTPRETRLHAGKGRRHFCRALQYKRTLGARKLSGRALEFLTQSDVPEAVTDRVERRIVVVVKCS
jgi:hypothetical protein